VDGDFHRGVSGESLNQGFGGVVELAIRQLGNSANGQLGNEAIGQRGKQRDSESPNRLIAESPDYH
jgi:hypothetical protein